MIAFKQVPYLCITTDNRFILWKLYEIIFFFYDLDCGKSLERRIKDNAKFVLGKNTTIDQVSYKELF